MRERLRPLLGQRKSFEGSFVRFGQKSFKEHVSTTVLLSDIKFKGGKDVLCDHIWLNHTKALQQHELKAGIIIVFDARVVLYVKGYRGRRDDEWEHPIEQDCKLSHPTNIRVKDEAVEHAQDGWFF